MAAELIERFNRLLRSLDGPREDMTMMELTEKFNRLRIRENVGSFWASLQRNDIAPSITRRQEPGFYARCDANNARRIAVGLQPYSYETFRQYGTGIF